MSLMSEGIMFKYSSGGYFFFFLVLDMIYSCAQIYSPELLVFIPQTVESSISSLFGQTGTSNER